MAALLLADGDRVLRRERLFRDRYNPLEYLRDFELRELYGCVDPTFSFLMLFLAVLVVLYTR